MDSPAVQARKIVFLCSLAAIIAASQPAYTTSYEVIPIEDVAREADAWIHAKVTLVKYGEVRGKPGMDSVRDVVVQFLILQSSHAQLTGPLTVQSVTNAQIRTGSEVFVALSYKQGHYVPYGLGFNGLIPIGQGSQIDGLPSDIYWRWLCALQRAGATNGQPPDDDLTYWETVLASDDVRLQTLALKYFRTFEVPMLEPSTILSVFLKAYETAAATVQPESKEYYEEKLRLYSVAYTVIDSLKPHDSDVYAGAILDFVESDATQLKLMQDHQFPSMILSPLRRATRPEIIERMPGICDAHMNPSSAHDYFSNLPIASNARLDAWLWEVVRDPMAHGVTDELQLASVWKIMATRNTPDLLPYLQRIVAGTEPLPVPPRHAGEPSHAKGYATDFIRRIERNSLSREERLVEWVRRVKQSEISLLPQLSGEITPRDHFLIPELASLSPAQWLYPGGAPSYSFAADIMKRLPDPVFLPTLREWCRKSSHPVLLNALEACGDAPLAKQKALAGLRTPIEDRRTAGLGSYEKAELLLLLGRIGGADTAKYILPYSNLDSLRNLEPGLTKTWDGAEETELYELLEMRDAALLALAKSGGAGAAQTMRTVYAKQDIRARVIAAMALYAIGDNTGIAIVNAFKNRQEASIPEIAERWRVDMSEQNFATPIDYLESPKLDALYFERTRETFTVTDDILVSSPDFLERNRTAILKMLLNHLDNKEFETAHRVMHCLFTITGKHRVYNATIPAERVAAIQWWKEQLATELETTK